MVAQRHLDDGRPADRGRRSGRPRTTATRRAPRRRRRRRPGPAARTATPTRTPTRDLRRRRRRTCRRAPAVSSVEHVVRVAVDVRRRRGDALEHVRQRRVRRLVAGQLDRARRRCGPGRRRAATPAPGAVARSSLRSFRVRRRLVALDARLAALDQRRRQRLDHLVGRRLRDLDEREPVGDLDRADLRGRTGSTRRRSRRPGPAGGSWPRARGRRRSRVVARPALAAALARRRGPASAPRVGRGARPRGSPRRRRRRRSASCASLHRGERDLHEVELVGRASRRRRGTARSRRRCSVSCSAARVSSSRRARRSATVGSFSTAIFCLVDRLDRLEQPVLARLGERDRDALAAGPADPADAVHVGLRRRRHVVVDDVGEVVDVEAARGDVGGDEQVGGLGCAAGP